MWRKLLAKRIVKVLLIKAESEVAILKKLFFKLLWSLLLVVIQTANFLQLVVTLTANSGNC